MNIVLSRLDRVGDLVLSTPAIASVRRSWPAARITIVCSRHNAVVVENSPDVDAVVTMAPGDSPARLGRRFRGACDLAIALAPCAADFALVGATRAPVRVGYTYVRRYLARLAAPLSLTRLGVSQADPELAERPGAAPVRHEVEQVLSLVELAGGRERHADLVVPIADVDRSAVAHVPEGAIVFHLGPRWISAGSTFESACALVGELRALGSPVVVTYGVDTIEAAAAIRARGIADCVAGGLSFAQWAAAFEKSRLVVTVDTGATHVASAVRRPTVVLFEHRYFTLSSQEWSPYRVPSACVRKPPGESTAELAASRAAIVEAARRLLGAPAAEPQRTA